jgi:biotin transport system ATP-binding protein
MDRIDLNEPSTAATNVSLANVCYSVDGVEILNGVTLNTTCGRLGVVGRNGSGKSTLARIVAGLIMPSDGTTRVDGLDLYSDRRAALSNVGILFQNPDHQIIFPTVLEEVCFGLRQQGKSKQASDEDAKSTLAKFGKSHWADAHVSALSQGQKHLVCMMAVVAMKPKLLILDEPFAGLDIPTRMQLKRYLSHYSGSLLHISHDPEDLVDCDRVVWLEKGRLQDLDTAKNVLPKFVAAMEKLGALDDISELTH